MSAASPRPWRRDNTGWVADSRGDLVFRSDPMRTADVDLVLEAVNGADALRADNLERHREAGRLRARVARLEEALREFVPITGVDRGQTFEDRERLRRLFRAALVTL